MRYVFCFLFILAKPLWAQNYPITLGATKVYILVEKGKGKTFIHLHENEVTALAAARHYIKAKGGSLIRLKHGGERNIRFNLKGRSFEFDPNRIFTDKGIKRTLSQFGAYSPEAHQQVKQFANKILQLLPNDKIIALHNNRSYSLKEYFPKNTLAEDAKAIHYKSNTNHRNFYFVTQLKEYNRLKKLKFNVALQADKPTDDGSLSYYLANKNYVNIEAAFNELNTQINMIDKA